MVAIAHDYLTQRGGAERVVLSLLRAFPEATLHTTLYEPDRTYPEFRQARIVTSPLNRVAALRRDHRRALPLLPWAASRMRIDADVVIASSSGWAHAFPTTGRRVVYCHSPARWLHQREDYLGGPWHRSARGVGLRALDPALRRWDARAATGGDVYLANAHVVRDRIRRVYGFDAAVVPAPHTVDPAGAQEPVGELRDWTDGFHLIVSRLLPYKNVDRAVAAFRGSGQRLVVVGDGPGRERLLADLPVEARLVSRLTDAQMRWCYARCRALVAPSIEDYGLTPLEAGAHGRPVVALRAGGYLDTVREGITGVYFDTPSPAAISAAVRRAAGRTWSAAAIRAHVAGFDEETFHARLHAEVERALRAPGVRGAHVTG